MEKAILIGVQTYTSHSFEERMEEMKELALACDIEICMSISQNLEHPHKKYYILVRLKRSNAFLKIKNVVWFLY